MKSKYSPRINQAEKMELKSLHKENVFLRNQLKEIGLKLNEIIEKKTIEKKEEKKIGIIDHKEQLKEANKIIEMYK